jgi:predicted enzyme related to lactoylglutathione lyase
MLPICVQTIYVDDLAGAIRFYSAALGYEVKATYGPCIAQLKTGATTLILEERMGDTAPAMPCTVLAFESRDIQADMRRVAEAGGQLLDTAPQRCPVGVYAMFKDPDGAQHSLLQFD